MKRIITVILLSALLGQGLDGRYHSVVEIYSYLDSLNQILNKHASELIGQDEVQSLLDNLSKTSPQFVTSTDPKVFPLNVITAIL